MTESEQITQREIWRKDPIRFMVEALDVKPEHIWPKMAEVAQSVVNNSKTVVGAGHGVSKTYGAARLVLWFLYCHCPSTVITTAPTHKQVEELLWREIREAHATAKLPLGGKPTRTKLDLQDETDKRWYALGFSTKPETVTGEATAMQGYHNDSIMLLFDEAAGILPQIWKAGQHLLTSGFTRWLVIGNPVSPTGNFAECLTTDDTWHKINISVLDTPNYKQGKDVIPGLSGVTYVQDMARKYGKESNEYKIRVLGQLPDYGEGTILGKALAKAKDNGQYGFYPWVEKAKVYTIWDTGSTHTVIWFVQFVKEQIRLMDFYYDCTGLGLPSHLKMLSGRPYIYGQHFVPWDVGGTDNDPNAPKGPNSKSSQTGKYFIDTAKGLGFALTPIGKVGKDDQYAAANGIIGKCLFHENLVGEGWEGLGQYRFKLDPRLSTTEKPVYGKDPVKDWTEHVGSAFCGLAVVYTDQLVIDHQRIGYPGPLRNYGIDKVFTDSAYDPLKHGLKVG